MGKVGFWESEVLGKVDLDLGKLSFWDFGKAGFCEFGIFVKWDFGKERF